MEDNQGIVKLQLEPTQEQSKQWIEKETRRRFDALMGNKEMLMRNAKATEIQAIIRGHLARAEVKRIHEKYDQQLRDEKARMIQSMEESCRAEATASPLQMLYGRNEKASCNNYSATGKGYLARLVSPY